MEYKTVVPSGPVIEISLTQAEVYDIYKILTKLGWCRADSAALSDFFNIITYAYKRGL